MNTVSASTFGALASAWASTPAPTAATQRVALLPGMEAGGALLRAEVEPAARGLPVDGHARRVLAALVGEPR